jgi:hypothetical protein
MVLSSELWFLSFFGLSINNIFGRMVSTFVVGLVSRVAGQQQEFLDCMIF